MEPNSRELLQMLRYELNYLEQGGFRRDREAVGLQSPFLGTMICVNFGDPMRRHSCEECSLHNLVPENMKKEEFPCHHIPLNASNDTIASLIRKNDPERLESVLKNWLRSTIARLEASLEKEEQKKGDAKEPGEG
jgi:hypothetical protein